MAHPQNQSLHISPAGIRLIKFSESGNGEHLEAYRCSSGVVTIGYGSTGKYPEGLIAGKSGAIQMGDKITPEEAEKLFAHTLKHYENAVKKNVEVPLTQGQFDALVSFTYNCGVGALESSTLLRVLNEGKYEEAANQLLRWNKGKDGEELAGLTIRRADEQTLFRTSIYQGIKAEIPAEKPPYSFATQMDLSPHPFAAISALPTGELSFGEANPFDKTPLGTPATTFTTASIINR